MSRPCDIYFTLERKLECFLRMTLGAFSVPQAEQEQALAFLAQLDMRKTANAVLQKAFHRAGNEIRLHLLPGR